MKNFNLIQANIEKKMKMKRKEKKKKQKLKRLNISETHLPMYTTHIIMYVCMIYEM